MFLGQLILRLKIFLNVSSTDLASCVNGLKPPINSHTRTAQDQMSEENEYPSEVYYLSFYEYRSPSSQSGICIISGAEYPGVPHLVHVRPYSLINFANPKSTSTSFPFDLLIIIFSALRSRKIMLRSWS